LGKSSYNQISDFFAGEGYPQGIGKKTEKDNKRGLGEERGMEKEEEIKEEEEETTRK
jgi:hypothetical protein